MELAKKIHQEEYWHKGHYWIIKVEGESIKVYIGAEISDQLFFKGTTNGESIPEIVSRAKDLIKTTGTY